jgi:dTDP-4-dehydrorhamnose reductase
VRVLVTGAGGQVGRALIRSAPATVHVIACAHTQLDISEERSVATAVSRLAPDAIVNAAAYTNVDRAESEVELATRINAAGPRYLASAAREAGARFLQLSTDYVFDGTTSTPYAPDAPTNPLSVYGATKRAGEEAVLRILPEDSVVLRTSWIFAADGRNFVRTMLRLMQTGGAVRVIVDQVGTPTSAHSVAETLWRLVQAPEIRGIHHWTDAGVASWYDFAVAIAEEGAALKLVAPQLSVTPIMTDEYPTPARRPHFSVLDKASLLSCGLMPTHWRKNLRSVLAEIKDA